MRPVRLAVRGFTAFRDEQELDFGGLDLFAIVGPTGSGKSSILDAMTYALFGEVDRVDERSVRQMISQGQPKMSVLLEFEVGHERYRVTRSTPRGSGPTKVMVERFEGGEWRQAGEGADRVRDANKMLEGLVGLDFDGFTRSVLLPQGKFSAFMAGDAAQRREILTDLLGLGLFERMGRRARQISKDASTEADMRDELAGSQYGHATPEALEVAREEAERAAARQRSLHAALGAVRDVAKRWQEVASAVRDLRACATEAADLASRAAGHAATLRALAARAVGGDAELERARAAEDEATRGAEAAAKARTAAEAQWGSAADVARAQEQAARLREVRADVDVRTEALRDAESGVPAAAAALARSEKVLAAATKAADRAAKARTAASDRLEEVRHADRVAALVASLSAGDPCPVCGEPLAEIPATPGADAVRKAEEAEAAAREQETAAARDLRDAELAVQGARAGLAGAERALAAAQGELDRCRADAERLEAAVTKALGGSFDDPAAELERRARELDALVRVERQAETALTRASRELDQARQKHERVRTDAATARAGLEALATAALAKRVAPLAPAIESPAADPLPSVEDLPALVAVAAATAEALRDYGAAVGAEASARAESESSFLDEARAAADDVAPPADTLEDLVAAIERDERDAVAARTRGQSEVERLERDLEAVAGLREQVRSLRARAATFRDLAKELQADRLIAFLQAEALQLLAVAGSRRLAGLSGDRYELRYEGEEFLVVDRWNGDDTRSVRTLSGGETFLASLALALALAEQVSSLAVTEHASLDSLFLDEGFGTLDPETLEVVVEAIEQLGGDGRMVGVITHVRDLADRLPARLEITKSPRGSTIRRAS